MTIVSRSSSTWVLVLKITFISIGVVSLAVGLRLSVPVMVQFAVNELSVMWKCFHTWLRPPYLYAVINGIIITIAASSRFHKRGDEQTLAPVNVQADFTPEIQSAFDSVESPAVYDQGEDTISEVKTVVSVSEVEEGDKSVMVRSNWTPPSRSEPMEIPPGSLWSTEKPLVSARFAHRKAVKTSPEGGKALRVAKPKRHETLENTWKTITEGRAMPLTRHLKKSDTWETHGRQIEVSRDDASPGKVKKWETFKDRTNDLPPSATSSPCSGRLRKEPSLSQDELNRRVEAFIQKFTEEMRLQRQESLNQYMEMINRGAQ